MKIRKKVVISAIAAAAVICFAVFLNVRSSDVFRSRKAGEYLFLNQPDKAIPLYRKILRKQSVCGKYNAVSREKLADVYFVLGSLLVHERRFNDAMEVFFGLAKLSPGYRNVDVQPYLSRLDLKKSAICCARAGLFPLAARQMEAYTASNPADPQGHFLLGMLHQKTGQFRKSIEHFFQAVSSASPQDRYFLAELHYRLGRGLEYSDNAAAAQQHYRMALELRPGYFFACSRLSDIYRRQGRLQDAQALCRSAVESCEYKVNLPVGNKAVLRGFSFDESEFNLFNQGSMVFFWTVDDKDMTSVEEVVNLSPDFGFELNYPGTGFPYGWDSDYYGSDENSHRVIVVSRNGRKSQGILLDNSAVHNTNVQSFYIPVEPGFYLQSGWLNSENGNLYFGRRWYDREKKATTYDYAVMQCVENKWAVYHQILEVGNNIGYSRLWLTNSDSGGKGYFDNILFIKLKVPRGQDQ